MSNRSNRLRQKVIDLTTDSLETIADHILDLEDQIETQDDQLDRLTKENADLVADLRSLEREVASS
jgi:cell division protein FtsB